MTAENQMPTTLHCDHCGKLYHPTMDIKEVVVSFSSSGWKIAEDWVVSCPKCSCMCECGLPSPHLQHEHTGEVERFANAQTEKRTRTRPPNQE